MSLKCDEPLRLVRPGNVAGTSPLSRPHLGHTTAGGKRLAPNSRPLVVVREALLRSDDVLGPLRPAGDDGLVVQRTAAHVLAVHVALALEHLEGAVVHQLT